MQERNGSHCWSCNCCKNAVFNLNKKVIAIEKRMSSMETTVEDNVQDIVQVKDKVDAMAKEIEEVKKSKSNDNNSEERVFKELQDREVRKENLVIHQLPEPSPEIRRAGDRKEKDEEAIHDLMDTMKCTVNFKEDVKYFIRAGEKKDNVDYQEHPRPLIIGFRNMTVRENILKNARNLTRSKHDKVSIVPDLTPRQRKQEADLRAEAENLNRAMDQIESSNWIWKVVGLKGQRKLIKTKIIQDDNLRRSPGRNNRHGARNTSQKRPRSDDENPSQGPSQKR